MRMEPADIALRNNLLQALGRESEIPCRMPPHDYHISNGQHQDTSLDSNAGAYNDTRYCHNPQSAHPWYNGKLESAMPTNGGTIKPGPVKPKIETDSTGLPVVRLPQKSRPEFFFKCNTPDLLTLAHLIESPGRSPGNLPPTRQDALGSEPAEPSAREHRQLGHWDAQGHGRWHEERSECDKPDWEVGH